MTTIQRDGYEITVSKAGFPLETCGRCLGTGKHSYNQLHGDVCYGCSGTGWQISAGTATTIRAEWIALCATERQRIGHAIVPGDEIARYTDGRRRAPYRTVATVEATGDWCNKSRSGNGPERVYYHQMVTFDDGETIRAGAELWHRKATIDTASYVERALAAHVAKLNRRARA